MKKITLNLFICLFWLVISMNADASETQPKKLTEIQKWENYDDDLVCGDVRFMYYRNGKQNSVVYVFRGKIIAYEVLQGRLAVIEFTTKKNNGWTTKKNLSKSKADRMRRSHARYYGIDVFAVAKCLM